MSNFNKVILVGNITADIELKETPNGAKVASFSIATNRYWKNKEGMKESNATFHNIVAWNRTAEVVAEFTKKGSKILVEGYLDNRSWESEDGSKRYKTEIVAENIQLLPSARSGDPLPEEPKTEEMKRTATANDDEPALEDIPF